MSSIGTKIRKLRELKGFKQEYMADQLGISVGAYSKLERDETEVSHERLQQIAKVFDLSVPDILSFDEKLIFNVMHNKDGTYNNNNGGTHYYQFPKELKQLYEDKVRLLEENIRLKEEKIESLQEEIKRLRSSGKA